MLKSLYGTRECLRRTRRIAVVPCLYWGTMLEALGVHWGDDFIFGIPDDRADDLEQLMREVFKGFSDIEFLCTWIENSR